MCNGEEVGRPLVKQPTQSAMNFLETSKMPVDSVFFGCSNKSIRKWKKFHCIEQRNQKNWSQGFPKARWRSPKPYCSPCCPPTRPSLFSSAASMSPNIRASFAEQVFHKKIFSGPPNIMPWFLCSHPYQGSQLGCHMQFCNMDHCG